MPEGEDSREPSEEKPLKPAPGTSDMPTRVYSPEEAAENLRQAQRRLVASPPIIVPSSDLPGAPNFTQYLKDLLGEAAKTNRREKGGLRVEERKGLDGSDVYFARSGGGMIGTYTVFPLEEGGTDRAKEFLFSRTSLLPGDYSGSVVLRWDKKTYPDGDGESVSTEWKRQDEFTDIPFP